MTEFKSSVVGADGQRQEINLSLDMYRAAADQGMRLGQYLNNNIDTDAEKYGTPFEQVLAASGMFLREDRTTGIKPPSMASVLNGNTQINMGGIVRPDGTNALTVAGRFLFPAVVLEMIESQLLDDTTGYEAIFNQMVAVNASSDSPRVDQPLINLSGPRGSRSQPIAQGAEPASMVTISLSEKSYRIPTFSIGLEITDEALKASTLDLVSLAVREQGLGERYARVNEDIISMVNGDTDLGISALSAETAQSYDSAITTAGTITQKAWLKYLRKDYMKLNIDWVMTDIDTYLAIEGRSGRPVWQTNAGSDERLNTIPSVRNAGIPGQVNFFLLADSSILGANTLVGIDSSKAIRQITYTGATYSAIEQFVMRKTTAMRMDFGVIRHRLFDGAWKKLALTV